MKRHQYLIGHFTNENFDIYSETSSLLLLIYEFDLKETLNEAFLIRIIKEVIL